MHAIDIPQWAIDRVMARRGRRHVYESLDPAATALLVVDMQNGFLMDGVAQALCVEARDIVPNVNALAGRLRAAGGTVVWIRNTFTEESRQSWSHLHDVLSLPEKRDRRIAALREGSLGHALWAEMATDPADLVVDKTRYSAFIQGSSDLDAQLRRRGIDTVLVTGCATNVCCESTARDAMMLNYKTLMVSDANAAFTDVEHNAALTAFYVTFGDVQSTQQVLAMLPEVPASRAESA
jgi:ureidoacrylate peracid hydrolase